MTQVTLSSWSSARTIINNASSVTSAPGSDSTVYLTKGTDMVSFISGTGSGTLHLWLEDGGTWYKGEEYDFGGDPIAVAWSIPNRRFTLQVSAITDGNVTVKVL